MNCRELAETLLDYITGELAEEHRRQIEEHLGCCPPCVTFIETYQVTIKLTRRLPQAPVPPELKERLEAALREVRKDSV